MLRQDFTPREEGMGVGPDGRDTLSEYCKRLASHPLLKKEEELELCRRIAKGDQGARDTLILHNMRLIISIARPYASESFHLKWEDLIQVGSIGALTAAEKFKLNRGCRFTTYATWWIHQNILRELHNNGDIIRIPVHVIERRNRILKAAKRLDKGVPPTMQEIADHLRISMESVCGAFQSLNLKNPVSLDSPFTLEDPAGPTIQDFIPDPAWVSPIRIIEAQQELEGKWRILEDILKAVKDSTPRDIYKNRDLMIFREIHGLNDTGEKKTRAQVAKDFGINRERVRQILMRSYKKFPKKEVASKKAFDEFLLSIQELEKKVGKSMEVTI